METSDIIEQKDNEIVSLNSKIEQLNEELKTATSEKIQSAQYGLVLLVSVELLKILNQSVVLIFCFLATGRKG